MTGVLSDMNSSQQTTQLGSTAGPASVSARRWRRIQFWIYLAVTVGVLIFLLWPGGSQGTALTQSTAVQDNPVRLTGPGHIQIAASSPLHQKLEVTSVKPQQISAPVLTVTGSVAASLRTGKGGEKDWQFNSPELLTTYTDWQKAVTDISFARAQLESIKQLADNRVRAQEALVARLKKLVEAGTDTERDLATAQTELLEAQIQGRKDLHEAETALRLAQRTDAALSRQLQQAGVDPDLLRVNSAEIDIVVADVPEAMLSRVKIGQGCAARFMGVDGKAFTGTVHSISPVLSRERRLRVLFSITDPEDLIRPGMFADIGLGTDARDAMLVPVAGVVHVGRSDYVLVQVEAGIWRVTPVQVGELRDSAVEILDGLEPGAQVIGQGAILLKPFIVEATQTTASRGVGG